VFEGPPPQRTVQFFSGTPEGGPLVMRVSEDIATTGPDGEPGVLALSWQEIPPKLAYSGFVYLGGKGAERRMTLPPLKEARTSQDLQRMRLKFRFKGVNEGSDTPVKLSINCRLEPYLPDSYARRLDFETFVATDDWGTFEMSLADGKNAEAFLRAVADENPAQFKIIWAHTGPIHNYHPGDTLLIDDVAITSRD